MRESVLQSILEKYIKTDFKKNVDLVSEDLLGSKIRIAPRTLAEIYIELKEICDIEELYKAVISNHFKTYNDLLKIPETCIEKKL